MKSGESFNTIMTVRNNGGNYDVEMILIQEVSEDLENWDQRKVKISGYGQNKEKAIADVYVTMQALLERCNNNLFNLNDEEESVDKVNSDGDTEDK